MTAAPAEEAGEYRSPLTNWHARASVRRSPRRILGDADAPLFFPPDLEPVVAHPLVAARGEAVRQRILIQRLHLYLTFTVELEATAVIPVASEIARGRSGLDLPGAMRQDAFKIVTDEAWHAQLSHDLMAQVTEATGVAAAGSQGPPAFSVRLADSAARVPANLRNAHALLAAVVSETLISALLAGLPHDKRLPGAVRAAVADHAEDEGRHHAYFRRLLRYLWPAFSKDERQRLGPLIPEMVTAFLTPDYGAVGASLRQAGLGRAETQQALEETYRPDVVRGIVAGAARPTVKYVMDAGALKDTATHDAFMNSGLLDDV